MSTMKYTVIISNKGRFYKICKIWFGSDGSYYVTVPYHPAKKAILLKQTVNYVASIPTSTNPEYWIPISDAIDVGSCDDAIIKLSHHPDGFIQFSGQGLLSGRNSEGSPKGIGINSWPLMVGCQGPAFSISVFGFEQFEETTDIPDTCCLFDFGQLTVFPKSNPIILEGHYFTYSWRQFIRTLPDGNKTIPIIHPNGAVLDLKALLPNDSCPLGGFIGLDFFSGYETENAIDSGYILASSTGNLRENEKGELLGDGLYSVYPRPESWPVRRKLDYK